MNNLIYKKNQNKCFAIEQKQNIQKKTFKQLVLCVIVESFDILGQMCDSFTEHSLDFSLDGLFKPKHMNECKL